MSTKRGETQVDDSGELSQTCESVCYVSGTEVSSCELRGEGDADEQGLETLIGMHEWENIGGFGGVGIFEDPAGLEITCTYDRSTSKPECDRE